MKTPRLDCSRILVLFAVLVGLVGYELSSRIQTADAIPAFARKYDFACNVCHVPGFPKLNDFGNLFRDHGFQLGSDQDLPDYEGITMGYWPVSIRTEVGYKTTTQGVEDTQDVTTGGFGFRTFQILSYGILARHISFGVTYAPDLVSQDFGTGAGGGDLRNAFIRLNTLERFIGGSDEGSYLLNLKVGKIEPDLPFSSFRNPTQFTAPIVWYNYVAGQPYSGQLPTLSTVSPGYSNANTIVIQRGSPGIELFGILPTDYSDGYLRYSFSGFSTNTPPIAPVGGGRQMYFYGHVTQSFGGYGIVTGQRIGLFGMAGTVPTEASSVQCDGRICQAAGREGRTFSRFGADVSLTYKGQANLFGSWVYAVDSEALFASQGDRGAQTARWNGAFVELDWYPTSLPLGSLFDSPNWLFIYRYDLIRNVQQGAKFTNDGTLPIPDNFNDVDSHTFQMRYYFHFNARTDIAWNTTFNYFRTQDTGRNGLDLVGQQFTTGFDFAF
jgi:hypothetical protein